MRASWIEIQNQISAREECWLVTGVAGFIGSNLLEALLLLNQNVIGLDNFSTGHKYNLDDVRARVGETRFAKFKFIEGDILDLKILKAACSEADHVLHQAALGSVPRSIADPLASHAANVNGFVNVLMAAKESEISRVVYASSSAVYGDSPKLPKFEGSEGKVLSPYALTKSINELYADVFERVYKIETIGLRYFNVFGPRQDPAGAYAAVVPRWVGELLSGKTCTIFGDGETSRDFCFIENVVEANILSALTNVPGSTGRAYNIACGEQTSLKQLYATIQTGLTQLTGQKYPAQPNFAPFRDGDVRHSLADISAAKSMLGYRGAISIAEGMRRTLEWYVAQHQTGQKKDVTD